MIRTSAGEQKSWCGGIFGAIFATCAALRDQPAHGEKRTNHEHERVSSDGTASAKKFLRPIHLWAIAVGLVISATTLAGTLDPKKPVRFGMLFAVLCVSVMYICFIFSYTELSTAIPHSGGPVCICPPRARPAGGLVAWVATLLEFVFAPPAIALAIGSCVHFRTPQLGKIQVAVLMYFVFAALNCWGVELAVTFELFAPPRGVRAAVVFRHLWSTRQA